MARTKVRKFLEHPIISLVFAGILIYSGLNEIWSTFWEDIRSHHFVSLCGLLSLVKAGLDLYDGKEQFGKFFHQLFYTKKEKDK